MQRPPSEAETRTDQPEPSNSAKSWAQEDHASESSIDTALRYVSDSLPDGIALIDENWRFIYANPIARQIGRIRPENLNRETIWEIYPLIVESELGRAFRDVADFQEVRHLDAFYYEPFQAWFELFIFPMQGGVAVHYRDITSIKEANAARQVTAEQLQEVLAATTDSVMSLDRQWCITYMNQRAVDLLAPSGNLLGRSLWECFPDALYDGSPFLENYRRAMNDGIAGEFEAYYPDPLNIWFHVMPRPSKDGIIIFFRDITKQKQATAALMQTEKLAAVGRLASSIAHEINNPLESVTNLIYLARQEAMRPETQQHLDMAEQELRRVSIITGQTLRFHRQSTKPRSIGCAELFTTVLDMYEGKLKNANIKVEKRKRAHTPVVCFEGEIRQVLNNLVGNSIDATPGGGRLLVRSREATDWKTGRAGLMLTVADTGSGIDAATQRKMFEAFFTTKGEGGTGLGLWISAEIVNRHQGRLRIRSSQRGPHRGTVATLFLPFQAAQSDKSSPAIEHLSSG